jgi:ATP-dependent DNA helicase RecG
MFLEIVDLIKILKLEQSRNFDNKSVFGGFETLVKKISINKDVLNIPSDFTDNIYELLSNYHKFPIIQRKATINKLLPELESWLENSQAGSNSFATKNEQKPIASLDKNNIGKEKIIKSRPASSNEKHTYIDLESGVASPLLSIPSVGPSKAKTFQKIGVFTLEDLLYYFPKRYEDFRDLKTINQLTFGDKTTVIGSVKNVYFRKTRKSNFNITELILDDGSANLKIVFFNQPYLAKKFNKNDLIAVSGTVDTYQGRLMMNNPLWEKVNNDNLLPNRIIPIYKLTKNLTQAFIQKSISQTVTIWAPRLKDYLPDTIIKSAKLMDLPKAITSIHLPDNFEELEKARERFSFDEIFFLQIGALIQKKEWQSFEAKKFPVSKSFLEFLILNQPFTLTNSQLKSIHDLVKDFSSGIPMSRLLQGDVGSGKTLVSEFGLAIMLQDKSAQAAFMAPTGILAEQHYNNILDFFKNLNLVQPDQICLLTGDTSLKDKDIIKSKLKLGEIRILIGTHALIEDPIVFRDLQFIVIDEQHRFGVQQRAKLREKGNASHLLVMTATPIPRSLALTVFGDLDLSVMDEIPPGRTPIKTTIVNPNNRQKVYNFIRSQIKEGRQAFVIYPLVELEDSEEEIDTKAAVNEFYRLQNEIFPDTSIGLLHGKLRPQEKEAAINDFRLQKYKILVSTTVIEVGVDIPNATVMVIEGANRFGLSQLHQLRGRVGRGLYKSYCLLIPENQDAIENNRLTALSKTNNGFILAEKDLELRGPGDFLGNRQSGFKDLQLMNIMNVKLIEKARLYAEELFNIDPNLTLDENKGIKKFLNHYWDYKIGELS